MLIRGNELNAEVRREVLAAFGYRWTFENLDRAQQWMHTMRCPTIEPVSDVQWLAAHAFHVTRDRKRLMLNRRYAEPAFLADSSL